jgi:hypothetical protein
MAVNKNFVVKNGLEVNTNLIVADTDAQKVGIGTTISRYLLHVNGGTGIGASSVYVTGISTVAQEFNVGLGGSIFTVLGNAEGTAGIGQSVGVGTGEPAFLLDVRSPVSTGQTALYVQGDVRITGDINLDDLRLDQLQVSGISSFAGLSTFASGITVLGLGATTTTLDVSGFSTFSDTVKVDTLTENRVVIVGSGKTLEDDANFTYDGTRLNVGTNLGVTGVSTFTGIGTFVSDLYVGGDLFINENITLDTNLNILGIATIGTLAVTGVATAALFGGYAALSAPASAETKNFAVTVAAKTSNNRYSGGSSNAYYIDGVEAPFLTLTPGRTYRFTLSSSDMSNHPFRFYLDATKSTAYTTDVTTTATYAEIIVTDTTPTVLHYQCSSHALMGNSVQTNSNTVVVSTASTFGGLVDINAGGQASTFKVEDLTDNRVVIAGSGGELEDDSNLTFNGSTLAIGVGLDVDGHTELDDVNVSGASTFTGAADFNGAVDVDGHTELDDVNVSGASTFTGAADFNGAVDIDGHTELDDVNVSGASTFTGAADFNGDIDVDGHTELDNLNVAGFSTFVGFATFSDYVFVQDGLNVAGVITATSFDGLGQIGVGSEGTFIGVGITMVDFKSSNASNTVEVNGTSGIATVTVTTGVSLGLAIALGG